MAPIRVYWTIDTATPTAAKATAHAQGHNLTVLSSAEVGGAFLTLCQGLDEDADGLDEDDRVTSYSVGV